MIGEIGTKIPTEEFNSFYRAVVEENDDPERRGRCRVRIWGLHTDKKEKTETEGIPVDELPWAEPCIPIFEGGISGFGMFGVPVQGAHVMIFFENGNYFQPRYFAAMPTMGPKEMPDKRLGFCDPDGTYPFKERAEEPDFHRLTREQTDETLLTTKSTQRILDIAAAAGGVPFSEPVSPYGAKYPNNWVFTTHGGITLELDSTPGSRRFHLYHPSDTYIECDQEGTFVIRSQKDNYNLAKGSSYVYSGENREVSADGESGKRTGSNYRRETGGNETLVTGGNKEETIDGNELETIGGTYTKNITGIALIDGTGNVTVNSAAVTTISGTTVALAGTTLSFAFTGTSTSTSTGDINMTSTNGDIILGSTTGDIEITSDAGEVHLNKP